MAEQKLPTIEEVFSWMRKLYDESYSGLTPLEKSEQHMYGTMVNFSLVRNAIMCNYNFKVVL